MATYTIEPPVNSEPGNSAGDAGESTEDSRELSPSGIDRAFGEVVETVGSGSAARHG